MTQAKKLKREIRARARKTGESYAAARRQVLKAREKESAASASAPVAAKAARPAAPRAIVGEAGVVKKTGHGYDHWFAVLDAFGALEKGHTASAEHLCDAHGVPGWHAQMITVAYERARGLRGANQSSAGGFQVSVSKTVTGTPADVVEAIRQGRRRTQWLGVAGPSLARALEAAFAGPKPVQVKTKGDGYAWLRFKWDGSTVEVRITGKPNGRASVVADNKKLADAGLVESRRALWRAALEGLAAHLGA
jgi:hypothetical protein